MRNAILMVGASLLDPRGIYAAQQSQAFCAELSASK
jgi:hypothetical protein